jgi:hypothetical protein
MPKYEIDIKCTHLEDTWDEPQHDVEGESPEAVLLAYFRECCDVDDGEEISFESAVTALGEDAEPVMAAADAVELVLQGGHVAFWVSDVDLFTVYGVHEETTERCPACIGHGRVDLTRGLSHVLQRAKEQVRWWDEEEGGQGPELENLRERSDTLIGVLRDIVTAVETPDQ